MSRTYSEEDEKKKETLSRQREPGSFRDPSGFLFRRNGTIYRQVNRCYQEDYERLISSGLYQRLVDENLLIPHEEDEGEPSLSEDRYKIIRPRPVSFISYPFEWSFGQLKQAALTTLRIQKLALEKGMSLKDASAYNIQFEGSHPVLIDTLSFEKYEEGKPWVAYRQFCQHFLAPLALMASRDIRLSQLLRVYIDGVPLDLASRLLPLCSRFNFSLLIHIHLHAKSQDHFGDQPVRVGTLKSFTRHAFLGLVDSLETAVRRLDWKVPKTEWAEYYKMTNYSEEANRHKRSLVAEFLRKSRPLTVWDLGANTGMFSRLASEAGIPTVAFDIDPAAVEMNYRTCVENKDKNLLPLWLDLTNPSPGLGWANNERMSFFGRGPADTVMALALIHHLAISNHLPLEKIADFFSRFCSFLIIEFIPKTDSQVQKLFLSREDIFPNYDRGSFEKAFQPYFETIETAPIRETERTLYLMKTRKGNQKSIIS